MKWDKGKALSLCLGDWRLGRTVEQGRLNPSTQFTESGWSETQWPGMRDLHWCAGGRRLEDSTQTGFSRHSDVEELAFLRPVYLFSSSRYANTLISFLLQLCECVFLYSRLNFVIHSFILLGTCYLSGSVLGTENIAVHKTNFQPPWCLGSSGERYRMKNISRWKAFFETVLTNVKGSRKQRRGVRSVELWGVILDRDTRKDLF